MNNDVNYGWWSSSTALSRLLVCLLSLHAGSPLLAAGSPSEANQGAGMKGEPLGPSNRRTGLVISEIMYHPAARNDGKNLEFIEIYNSDPAFVRLGNYRLNGSIRYTFPSDQVIQAGEFLVVAKSSADLALAYGLTNVLGGWEGDLPNDTGTVQFLNSNGAILWETQYGSDAPWPLEADGAGSSLVLARPSCGERDPMAWAKSAWTGGSPGKEENTTERPLESVRINEVLANSGDDSQDFIELYNHSTQAVDLEGCILTDNRDLNRYRFPEGARIAPGGFLALYQENLGFGLKSAGETVYLFAPDRRWVVDAVQVGGQAAGISAGRFPDGAEVVRALRAPTPGASNPDIRISQVVINEIMYHPISEENDDQFIELYNRGTTAVDVSGWRFIQGIDYEFPGSTVIPAGGYLVVARNAERLRSRNPGLNPQNTVGDFNGQLSGRGERLVLAKPQTATATGQNDATAPAVTFEIVNEVTYGTGGRWGQWSDGGGSSLELIDPRSDNRLPSNWADSDETAKAPWTTVEHTGVLDLGVGPADSLQILLQGTGECLVDNVEVIAEGGTNLVANSTFETGTGNWTMQGTHDRSGWESAEGYESNGSLHVRADGRGDAGANRIRASLRQPRPVAGQTATLRARARWLRGVPGILLRFRGNWLEAAGELNLPNQAGTPGVRNSRAVDNAGPAIYDVTHRPILPAALEKVVVTARAHDPDGVSRLVLHYRMDPDTNRVVLPMTDDGQGGDAVAQDGIYSAAIPGQPAGVLAAFYVEVTDQFAPSATTLFPADAPGRECLVRFGETVPEGDFGTYRIWLTRATANKWTQRLKLHNGPLDATFVLGHSRAIYNTGAAYAGSPWIRPNHYTGPTGALCGYELEFPDDDLFLGDNGLTLDHAPRDTSLQLEQIAYWMGDQLGVPSLRRRFVHLFVNGLRRGKIYEDCQKPDRDVLRQFYPDDENGDLFKLDDGFEFDDSATTFTRDNGDPAATLENFTTTGGLKKTARYRWHWRKRAETGSVHDYASLFALVEAANARGEAYPSQVQALVDVDEWMRVFAVEHMVGNWDSYGYRRGKNMYAYKPTNGKWQLIMWDIDFVMSAGGDAADMSMFAAADPVIRRMFNQPALARAYFQAIREAVDGPLLSSRVEPLMDALYAALRTNGITATQPAAAKSYIQSRRNNLIRDLNTLHIDFAIINNEGRDFSAASNLVELTGTAPIGIKSIRVNGFEYPIRWQNVLVWSIRLPLQAGTNSFSVQGFDLQGKPWTNAPHAIQITYTGPLEKPEDFLAINEIMYHPPQPGAQFVEIHNASPRSAFDLSGFRMEGLAYSFVPGTVIGPREYLVVVQDREAFLAAYGGSIPIAGQYSGQLRSGGELLRLIQPGQSPGGETVVDEVAYSDQFPWPQAANGQGGSLQLLSLEQSHQHPANWGAITPDEAARPQWRFVSVTGTAAANSHLLVYHSPYQEPLPFNDIGGHWVGFIDAGGRFDFTATFYQQSNLWSGSVNLGEDIPLTSVKVETNSVKFLFNYGTEIRWEGRLTPDGSTIRGTFYQPGFSLPFTLNRQIDPTDYRGGEIYVDDLMLVSGTVPEAGVNLVEGGDFESPLTKAWRVADSHRASRVTNAVSHSGQMSLLLAADWGGRDEQSALWQPIASLAPGQTYTLSYWYLPSTKGRELTVRLADSDIASAHSFLPATAATPGAPNSIRASSDEILPLRLTEVQPENVDGPADAQGHRVAWVEIHNAGRSAVSLQNCYLSMQTTNLAQWAFPAQAVLQPGQYQLIWLDAAPGETTASEWHASFHAQPTNGWIVLSRLKDANSMVLDSLFYQQVRAGQSFGLLPGGQKAVLSHATPGQSNRVESVAVKLWINEWMANNARTIVQPVSGRYADWFEIYNPSPALVDLSGYSLTDNLQEKKWLMPAGSRIGPGEFLLIWADGNGASPTPGNEFSVNFKLDQAGETIGLYSPEGLLVDSVSFGPQQADVSQGRWPDGHDGSYHFMKTPTPGRANLLEIEPQEIRILSLSAGQNASWILAWSSEPGRTYQVQFKEQLADPLWQNLGAPVTATENRATLAEPINQATTQRFYRVILP